MNSLSQAEVHLLSVHVMCGLAYNRELGGNLELCMKSQTLTPILKNKYQMLFEKILSLLAAEPQTIVLIYYVSIAQNVEKKKKNIVKAITQAY